MRDWMNKTHVGDCSELLKEMAADGVRVQTVVTSPPYWGLRDYGVSDQIGLEPTLAEWVARLVEVFRAVRDVLADDGTLWLNLGDSYSSSGRGGNPTEETSGLEGGQASQRASMVRRSLATPEGIKPKELLGQPWRVAFALQADGWYLRSDIIWHKPNVMPESVEDRPTKAHEHLFLLSREPRYYYNAEAISEPSSPESHARAARGRSDSHKWADGGPGNQTIAKKSPVAGRRRKTAAGNRYNESFDAAVTDLVAYRNARSVWTIPTEPFSGAHFATFPRNLVARCILAGSRPGDAVLDPFMGSGTVAQVATDLARSFVGCELNPKYVELHDMRRTTIGMAI
jgi:DNA modification methylase